MSFYRVFCYLASFVQAEALTAWFQRRREGKHRVGEASKSIDWFLYDGDY